MLNTKVIYSYRQCGKSAKFIIDEIGVHPSTVYRELKRNCNCNKKGGYAHNANEMAQERGEW